tara:strand:- start:23 stop:589 length:567 start_codon:yes stop_codon:yes gene_type:complete
MTTKQTCEICMEDKLLSQHTYCPNGHLGGCQKCHMNLVKSLYEGSTNGIVFSGDLQTGSNTTAQKCMFCREHMWDRLMGEGWSKKLSNIQPILVYNMMKRLYGFMGEDGELNDIVEQHKRAMAVCESKTEDYKFIDGAFLVHDENINDLCKTLGDVDGWIKCKTLSDYTKEIHEDMKSNGMSLRMFIT